MHGKQRKGRSGATAPKGHGVRFKIAASISVLVVLLMAADVVWNYTLQQKQAESEAREKAEVLADEMRAVWDFVDINQNVLNRNEDGTFRSKALVCVVASKSVSMLFTTNTDYTIRFTNNNPRQAANAPDQFEAAALEAFRSDPTLESFYRVESDESGGRVFRYAEPLHVTETCLECHGDPVGELDQYGYEKEGMLIGDVGGAMSIVEPMNIYVEGMRDALIQQIAMVFIVLVAACAGIYFLVSRLILDPLDELRGAVSAIDHGRFDYSLDKAAESVGGPDEITDFVRDFDKMARRLERLCTNLEGEVRRKTEEMRILNDMLMYQQSELKKYIDRLGEETAYKNEFFAIMSHELRTPLTSILAFARILRGTEGLDAKTREAVIEIESNATILLDMVNNILVLSRAEAKKNELLVEPVDFVDLLGAVKNSLSPLAADKDISLTAHADAEVPVSMADWEKLRRIVENLTSNAIKYTHRGGTVEIGARFDAEQFDEGAVVLEVADDGIGIAPEDQKEIFNLYEQSTKQSPNRRYRGTGLGLAVVKELVALHGGTVSVESQRKKGSTFTVSIPYVPVDTEDYDDEEDYAR